MISLSAKQPVSGSDVKNAKSILKAAERQSMKEHGSTFKQAGKDLTNLRKKKDKDTAKLTLKIDSMQQKLDKVSSMYDSRIEKVMSVRDKAAAKAGITTPVTVDKIKSSGSSKSKRPTSKAKEVSEDEETKSPNVKLRSKHKDSIKLQPTAKPDDAEQSDDDDSRDAQTIIPDKVKPTSPTAPDKDKSKSKPQPTKAKEPKEKPSTKGEKQKSL
jgi:hypothetical protein